jgi:hypothetical protein
MPLVSPHFFGRDFHLHSTSFPQVKASRLARTTTLPYSLGAIIGTLLPHGKTSNSGWLPNAPHANASRRPNG